MDISGLVGESHGQLIWLRCPHCGGELHRAWRERDYSHESYAKCFRCNYGSWERDHERQILERLSRADSVA